MVWSGEATPNGDGVMMLWCWRAVLSFCFLVLCNRSTFFPHLRNVVEQHLTQVVFWKPEICCRGFFFFFFILEKEQNTFIQSLLTHCCWHLKKDCSKSRFLFCCYPRCIFFINLLENCTLCSWCNLCRTPTRRESSNRPGVSSFVDGLSHCGRVLRNDLVTF